ncbi:phosphotransferase [Bremerella sp. T1]|uniref:phosphotransferase n=1 Tax=Bremerella sp. TYQ1 TaxID=3119568 RepID=UPI001CCB11F1|nr:phosphotransferase [Bremerella volcania]UBM36445.1 phosphotransferase [Bremerella volcania]
MTYLPPTIAHVLARFQIDTESVSNLVACEGGLSGSEAWKVVGSSACFCLKRMPAQFSVKRIEAIHAAANSRRKLGMTLLAGFLSTADDTTWFEHADHLWELQTWMPGEPPFWPYPGPQKQAMFHAIGQFHALHTTPLKTSGLSPGIGTRKRLLEDWPSDRISEAQARISRFGHPQWEPMLSQFLDSFATYKTCLAETLTLVDRDSFELSDRIADPRPENFRFQGEKLTGLFDLGSMRWDNVALDVARLASEVAEEGQIDWPFAFEAMQKHRPLSPPEERLAIILDAANVLLTGLNWIQWLVVDGISFRNCDHVSARLAHIATRLTKIGQHAAWNL